MQPGESNWITADICNRCVENCDTHVRVEDNMTVSASCANNCWSHIYGSTVIYRWSLFAGGSSLAESFVQVPNFYSIATGQTSSTDYNVRHTKKIFGWYWYTSTCICQHRTVAAVSHSNLLLLYLMVEPPYTLQTRNLHESLTDTAPL